MASAPYLPLRSRPHVIKLDAKKTEYRADIDGLRAIAVLLVVGFHAFPLSIPGGFVGVDVFFVISGFLITRLILEREMAGVFTIRDFYIRRALRILPALSVVLLTTVVVGWFFAFPSVYKAIGLDTIAGALFIPNLVFWNETGYFGLIADHAPLLHLWSLGIEEQFYLVWPCLLLLLVRRLKVSPAPVLAALSALSLIYSSVAAFHDHAAAFYSPFSRMWELGAGGILASLRIDTRYPETFAVAGFIAIMASAFGLSEASPFPGLLAIAPVAGTSLMIIGRSHVLAMRPLVGFGLISYPLYLWHWPLLSLIAILDFHTELSKALAVAISVLLAWFTRQYVEYPVRFGSLRQSGLAIVAAATAVVFAGGFFVFASDGLPNRFPFEIQRVLAFQEYKIPAKARLDRCWLNDDSDFSKYEFDCRKGDILVWGDSYAAFLATGLPEPYAQFVRSGCMPVLGVGSDVCMQSNALVADEIIRLKPKRLILFARWLLQFPTWSGQPTLATKLETTLRKLKNGIDDVILLGPSPYLFPDVPELVYQYWKRSGELPDRLNEQSILQAETDKIMSAVALGANVRYFSMLNLLCNTEGCLTHTLKSKADLLIWDYGHLTTDGADYVVSQLGLAKSMAGAAP
jgi:peptidoglycan/LPS O-acetylase OafA/YrhL